MALDIVAQTQSLTSDPRGTEVQVEVAGVKGVPKGVLEMRARARALISAGVASTTADTIADVTMGEINRLTEVTQEPIEEDRGFARRAVLYTVVVNREEV